MSLKDDSNGDSHADHDINDDSDDNDDDYDDLHAADDIPLMKIRMMLTWLKLSGLSKAVPNLKKRNFVNKFLF